MVIRKIVAELSDLGLARAQAHPNGEADPFVMHSSSAHLRSGSRRSSAA
jgi:hypothetical protein